MAQLNGLPVFKITFNEDPSDKEGIDFVSLVDYPAIESNWIAMAKAPVKFSSDKDKQLLYGPILIPDKPIYRYDLGLGEYYVVFTKETIAGLVRKFQRQQKTINLNYQHQKDTQIKSAVVQEIWLTGKVDKSQTMGFDLPEGTAFVCAHIGDEKFWNDEVKSGNVLGFSIEGYLDMEMKKMGRTGKFDVVQRADSNDLYIIGEVKIGNTVYSNMPQRVLIGDAPTEIKYPCWELTVELKDGQVLILENGVIKEIKSKNSMSANKFITAKTDKGIEVKCDGESFTTGAEVYTEKDGNKTALSTGDYTLENGTVLKVVDGKISEVVESEMTEQEVAQEVMSIVNPEFEKLRAEMKSQKDAYEAKIKELETKLSLIPGQKTQEKKDEKKELTQKQKLAVHLSILRKKSQEVKPTKK